jgi:hypothetical protein
LHGPLGLVLAPNGDLIAANGDGVNADPTQPGSELVEFTPRGSFVGQFSIDVSPAAPFGLALTEAGGLVRLAAVDDDMNTLDVWTLSTGHRFWPAPGGMPVTGSLVPGTGVMSTDSGSASQAIPAGPLALPGSPFSKSLHRFWA